MKFYEVFIITTCLAVTSGDEKDGGKTGNDNHDNDELANWKTMVGCVKYSNDSDVPATKYPVKPPVTLSDNDTKSDHSFPLMRVLSQEYVGEYSSEYDSDAGGSGTYIGPDTNETVSSSSGTNDDGDDGGSIEFVTDVNGNLQLEQRVRKTGDKAHVNSTVTGQDGGKRMTVTHDDDSSHDRLEAEAEKAEKPSRKSVTPKLLPTALVERRRSRRDKYVTVIDIPPHEWRRLATIPNRPWKLNTINVLTMT